MPEHLRHIQVRKSKVSGGDYGWRIDYDKVIAQTMKALKKAPEESAIKAYEKDPSKENEQALLTSLKPVYSHKRISYGLYEQAK